MSAGLIVDLFAGGGGASAGLEAALGRPVDIAINHDPIALAVHKANHPDTRHLDADIWEVKPQEAVQGRQVAVLWASPDCTHFSVAKGDVPRSQNIRSLAWAVVRWAKAVRPRVIFLENVSEFRGWGPLGSDGKPDKARMGQTFRRWCSTLQNLGYIVDYRVLDASLYGAPTRRRRLFLVARCDGQPIRWPEPTHGPGLAPVHTAAECIDWSIPCPSIFERKRPLADKTLWRIAQGIRRFVLENPRPFIVPVKSWSGGGNGPRSGDAPMPTITTSKRGEYGIVTPALMKFRHDSGGAQLTLPMPTITSGGKPRPSRPATGNPLGLLAPSLVKVNHGKHEARGEAAAAPLSTVTATQRGHALVTPTLKPVGDDNEYGPDYGDDPDLAAEQLRLEREPDVIAPTLIQAGYGERKAHHGRGPDQRARVLDLGEPLGTVVAQGQKHALVSAFLAKHFGGVVGHELGRPVGAVTAKDHHSLAAATLVKFRGNEENGHPGCAAIDLPAPTLAAQGNHIAEVRAFLTAFYSTDGAAGKGQGLRDPLRTLTAKHRLGLVTVEGVDYQIVDIGMRMLEPHELLRAQFGRFADLYDLSAARTKAAKVRLIGNSVCPEIAEAIVRANPPDIETEAVA